jgi:hypothetical protein
MKIKILSLLMISGLMFHLTGCTSSNDDTKDTEVAEAQDPALDSDSEGAQAAEDMDKPADESADAANVDGDKAAAGDDLAADEEVVADNGENAQDQLPEDSLEKSKGASDDDLLADDSAAPKDELADESAISENKDEGVFDAPADASSTNADTAVADAASTDVAPTDAGMAPPEDTAPKPMASYKKMKEAPFQQSGSMMNTVYVGRKGDSWKGVSEKIFGSNDHAKELKKFNPALASREVKVGDKIYYNSPKRPQDGEKMLTFYEDNGIPSQTYTAKAGDDMHKVGKELLGDKNSWKELWATNMAVESKSDLAEGTEIRYWGESSQAAAPAEQPHVAETAAPPPPTTPKGGDDFALPDDMTKNQQANNNAGPAAGTVAAEPPPPPPPPPPVQPPQNVQKTVASNGMDKDLTFMLSAGGLLLVGVGVLLGIVRKSRARKMSMNTHTQI